MASLYLQLALLLGLPAIYVLAASAFAWSGLNRPWLFVAASAIALYVAYFCVVYLAAPRGGGYFLEQSQNGSPSKEQGAELISFFLQPYLKPMLLFSCLALPLLWVAIKLFRR